MRIQRGLFLGSTICTALLLSGLTVLAPLWPDRDAKALPAWSRKYDTNCALCHTPNFARLTFQGERFLWNGYQAPDAPPDGDEEGKKSYGGGLFLDNMVGHWFTARLNLTPVQWESNSLRVENELEDRLVLGNTNWLQIFVGGSIYKNLSVYIENEITPEGIHQAWYYMGLHNLGGASLLNFQFGRLSPLVFAPYPDRLPQLPAIGGGVMRVRSSGGTGQASLDLRSARHGIQYYGYEGPVMIYGGVTPGPTPVNAANNLGFWAGGRLFIPQGGPPALEGSSVGIHFDSGTDTREAATLNVEDSWTRIMPGFNLRYDDTIDLQGAFVIGKDDNWNLAAAPDEEEEVEFSGLRMVGSYIASPKWVVSFHYDNFSAKDEEDDALLPEYHMLFLPVLTYLPRENLRVSLYPGLDLRDVDSDLKRNTVFLNLRTAF